MPGRSRFGQTELAINQFIHLARVGDGCIFLTGWTSSTGWRDDLTRATTTSDEPLTGLLLACPAPTATRHPSSTGKPVPVVTAGQWTSVPTSWLQRSAA